MARAVDRLDFVAGATSAGELHARLADLAVVHGPAASRVDEVHLDTHTDELATAGLSLRLTEHGGVRMLELAVFPLEPAPRGPPPIVRTRALTPTEMAGSTAREWIRESFGLGLAESPREVFALTIHRRRWAIVQGGATVDLVADDVVATEPHGARARLLQMTLEAAPGSTIAPAIVGATRAVQSLSVTRVSLAERARTVLGLHMPRHRTKPRPVSGEQALVDAGRQVVAGWWAVAAGHVPGVRVGLDIEHVHKMRVALRRLRTALRLFGDAFDPGALASARASLRAVARGLGLLRDADVQRAAVPDWRERFPDVPDSAWDDVDARLGRMRAEAYRDALALLDGEAWRTAATDVERLLRPDERGLRHTVGAVARDLVRRRAKRCRDALKRAADGDAAAVHAFRIEVKALRYTMDFLGDALPPEIAAAAEPLAELQESLGAIQDWVFTGIVADALFVMPPPPVPAVAHALGLLAGHGRAKADGAVLAASAAVERLDIVARLALLAADAPAET